MIGWFSFKHPSLLYTLHTYDAALPVRWRYLVWLIICLFECRTTSVCLSVLDCLTSSSGNCTIHHSVRPCLFTQMQDVQGLTPGTEGPNSDVHTFEASEWLAITRQCLPYRHFITGRYAVVFTTVWANPHGTTARDVGKRTWPLYWDTDSDCNINIHIHSCILIRRMSSILPMIVLSAACELSSNLAKKQTQYWNYSMSQINTQIML